MALVMKLRSRCKKGCQCEHGTAFHGNHDHKSNKPVATDTKLTQTTSGAWVVSNGSSNPPVLKDSKDNKNITRKSAKSKMSSQNQKNTKENQNCKTVSRKAIKRSCSEYPKPGAKMQRLSSSKSNKEQTKSMHIAEGANQKPKKGMNEDVTKTLESQTVPNDTVAIVNSVCKRTRRNPPRKCVQDNQHAVCFQKRSKLLGRKQTSCMQASDMKIVCDAPEIQNHEPSTSALPSSVHDIKVETQKINSKTNLIGKQIAELEDELSKENGQIKKLKNLVAKSQVLKSIVDKKKQQVQQTESRRLMRRLDWKESDIEERTTQLEKRLQTEVKINQKEMQKLKKDLTSDWQKKMNQVQCAIRRKRHELRTNVVSWRKEKETLNLETEQKLERLKKTYSRHKYFTTCKRQLKQMQKDLENQKSGVEKEAKSDAEKAVQLKKLDAELNELKMLMNLLSMSPKDYMKVMAKRKEKEQLCTLIEEGLECLICSEILIQATVLNCSHTFCQHCIIRWTKRRDHCPVCRTGITTKYSLEDLDRYIDKVVDKFDDAFKERRKKAIDERTEQERQLRRQEEAGYFDDHSDSDSSGDDFWDVWDDDDDDNLSVDFGDDGEGSWDDWDDDLLSDNNDDVSSDSTSSLSSDTDGGFDDDNDDDDDDDDDDDSDTDSYDCVIC